MILKLGPQLFNESYVDIVYEFAERNEWSEKIVSNVAYNNGIDFLKAKAIDHAAYDGDIKLALYSIAATHNREDYLKVERALANSGHALNTQKNLAEFKQRLSNAELQVLNGYLSLFEME